MNLHSPFFKEELITCYHLIYYILKKGRIFKKQAGRETNKTVLATTSSLSQVLEETGGTDSESLRLLT